MKTLLEQLKENQEEWATCLRNEDELRITPVKLYRLERKAIFADAVSKWIANDQLNIDEIDQLIEAAKWLEEQE